MKLGTVSSQENDTKIIKSKGYLTRFLVTMLTNTALQDPLAKAASSPKLD